MARSAWCRWRPATSWWARWRSWRCSRCCSPTGCGWAGRNCASAWRLPGQALGWGLPLTLAITAVGAHYLVGLGWTESLLIGAILAPTDPVFAAALVGNEKVPPRLRQCV
ncbi:cation:proton antiporter [Nonomuraea sp. NPDC050022]|uniref:cation:proton antiporter domain-containing protein n=1 Tax=Nonomuraea sp. NPDC050022 TaxID=3364358 RepID=UPI00379ACCA9